MHFLLTTDLTVRIVVDYTPPSTAVVGPNEYQAGSIATFTCEVAGANGTVTYSWSSTCPVGCSLNGLSGPMLSKVVINTDNGTTTCSATDQNGNTGSSDSIEIIVVGKCQSFCGLGMSVIMLYNMHCMNSSIRVQDTPMCDHNVITHCSLVPSLSPELAYI